MRHFIRFIISEMTNLGIEKALGKEAEKEFLRK